MHASRELDFGGRSVVTQRGQQALAAARRLERDIVAFLRDMIAIPAESRHERERCQRVRREFERLAFDDVFFDGLGTVVGRIGRNTPTTPRPRNRSPRAK